MNSIRSYFEEEEKPHTAAESLLDEVFQASLALEGKTKAYEWLVRAQYPSSRVEQLVCLGKGNSPQAWLSRRALS